MLGDEAQERIQSSNTQDFVVGNGDTLVGRRFSVQNNVTADLMDLAIAPIATEQLDQVATAEITR